MSRPFTLTPEARAEFLERGMLHIPGLIPAADAPAMADRLWEACARRHGALPGRPDTWTKARVFQFQDLR
jgi:hypothetical protein